VFDVLRGDTNREYGTALFLWYLNNFYGDRYQQLIVKRFWEQLHANVPPLQKDTVDAVTEVLLHPDEGTSPYGDYPELWQSLFADFILADYLKGAYPALVGQPGGDWGTWPADKDLVTVLQDWTFDKIGGIVSDNGYEQTTRTDTIPTTSISAF